MFRVCTSVLVCLCLQNLHILQCAYEFAHHIKCVCVSVYSLHDKAKPSVCSLVEDGMIPCKSFLLKITIIALFIFCTEHAHAHPYAPNQQDFHARQLTEDLICILVSDCTVKPILDICF